MWVVFQGLLVHVRIVSVTTPTPHTPIPPYLLYGTLLFAGEVATGNCLGVYLVRLHRGRLQWCFGGSLHGVHQPSASRGYSCRGGSDVLGDGSSVGGGGGEVGTGNGNGPEMGWAISRGVRNRSAWCWCMRDWCRGERKMCVCVCGGVPGTEGRGICGTMHES